MEGIGICPSTWQGDATSIPTRVVLTGASGWDGVSILPSRGVEGSWHVSGDMQTLEEGGTKEAAVWPPWGLG